MSDNTLIHIGWCERGEGHADVPEPGGGGDFGICGSKWTFHAWMTPWAPYDAWSDADVIDEAMIERAAKALQLMCGCDPNVDPDHYPEARAALRAALQVKLDELDE